MSKNKNKETHQIENIDEIRKITRESKEIYSQLLEEAAEEAFDEIVKDSLAKIKSAASKGMTRSFLYRWQYVENSEINHYTFKDVKIMELIKRSTLMDRLKKYFNPEGKIDGYQIGWKRFEKRYDDEPTQYGIYISWYKPSEPKSLVKESETNLDKELDKELDRNLDKGKKKWKKITK